MSHQPATTAPPECITGCGHDGEVRVIDRGGAVDMCVLDVIALLGTCEGRMALVIDDELVARREPCGFCRGSGRDPLTKTVCPICHGAREVDAIAEPWERGDDRTDASGPDLPDWPEENTEKEI